MNEKKSLKKKNILTKIITSYFKNLMLTFPIDIQAPKLKAFYFNFDKQASSEALCNKRFYFASLREKNDFIQNPKSYLIFC